METLRGYTKYQPDMHFTMEGVAVTNFTVYTTLNNDCKTETRIVTWGELAESCIEKLALQDYLFLKGYYKLRSWIKPDGIKVTIREFTAKQIWVVENDNYIDIAELSFR